MIAVYRIIFLPIFLAILPFYLGKLFRRGLSWKQIKHKLGFVHFPKRRNKKLIWIHAVSVGEVKALALLIKNLHEKHKLDVYLTTTTITGYSVAKKMYSDQLCGLAYFPLDFWLFSSLAWKRIKPHLALLTESEIWPEHLHQAKKRKTPLFLINARLSDRSYRRYSKVKFVASWLFNHFEKILAASKQDYSRIIELIGSAKNVKVTGNLKLDNAIIRLADDDIAELKNDIAHRNELILLGSATWPGEEKMLLKAYKDALSEGIKLKLVLVPRHEERRASIKELLDEENLGYKFRSGKLSAKGKHEIYVADTTGELTKFTALADVIFVGKSLAGNFGGQSPLEAAGLGKAIVFGKNMNNFQDIASALLSEEAAIECANEHEAIVAILSLLKDQSSRETMGRNAINWLEKNQGATEKTLSEIMNSIA